MTKKSDTTTLMLAGGLLAAIAVGAAMLLRRPGVQGGETFTPTGNFWDKVPAFTVHNGLATNGYGLNFNPQYNGSNNLYVPVGNPLPPLAGGYYGVPVYQQIANQYTSPPATSSPGTPPSGYTLPGSTGGTGTGFGVSAGGYYR